LNHLLQHEFANQIVNLILQDQNYRLLEEYIIEGDDYAYWFQWAIVEESKNLNGCSINVPMFNLVHLSQP
jgi:hypothetical protein